MLCSHCVLTFAPFYWSVSQQSVGWLASLQNAEKSPLSVCLAALFLILSARLPAVPSIIMPQYGRWQAFPSSLSLPSSRFGTFFFLLPIIFHQLWKITSLSLFLLSAHLFYSIVCHAKQSTTVCVCAVVAELQSISSLHWRHIFTVQQSWCCWWKGECRMQNGYSCYPLFGWDFNLTSWRWRLARKEASVWKKFQCCS